MTLDEYIKEQRERVANMTLAQARQIVANHYGHDDMRIECEKAVWMLLNCADEKINNVDDCVDCVRYADTIIEADKN